MPSQDRPASCRPRVTTLPSGHQENSDVVMSIESDNVEVADKGKNGAEEDKIVLREKRGDTAEVRDRSKEKQELADEDEDEDSHPGQTDATPHPDCPRCGGPVWCRYCRYVHRVTHGYWGHDAPRAFIRTDEPLPPDWQADLNTHDQGQAVTTALNIHDSWASYRAQREKMKKEDDK